MSIQGMVGCLPSKDVGIGNLVLGCAMMLM